MSNGAEVLEEALDYEWGDEGYDGEGLEEARFRPRRVATAKPQPLPPRPADRPVTQAQLQMAVNKLNGDISRNSTAIQRVNASVGTLGRDVKRQTAQVRSSRKDIGQLRDALVLLPLLTNTLGTSNPLLAALFPMLLLSGVGEGASSSSSSGGGGLLGGGDSSTTLLLVLALSGALGGGK